MEPNFFSAVNQLARDECIGGGFVEKNVALNCSSYFAAEELAKATSKVAENNGQYYLAFHHYRPEKRNIGIEAHKDFNYITVLSINKPGLIAKLNGVWGSVLPKENCFIVNFGCALELLVNDTNRLTAALHAVEQIQDQEGRISFGLFADGASESPLYRADKDGSLEVLFPRYQDYILESFKKAYETID